MERQTQIDDEWVAAPAAGLPAELLVAILYDEPSGGGAARRVAYTWARSLPHAAFAIPRAQRFLQEAESELTLLLARFGLPPGRLLLVGLDSGAQIGFALLLRPSQRARPALECSALLAFDAKPEWIAAAGPVDAGLRVRLIGDADPGMAGEAEFVEALGALVSLGVDVRGTQLAGDAVAQARPSPAAIRLGAAYLGELSAAALARGPQRGSSGHA